MHYWEAVLELTNKIAGTNLPLTMEVCLLGIIDNVVRTSAKRTLVSVLLFYARKNVAMHWKKPSPPSLVQWRRLVNTSLPLYKDTYANRGCPQKYDRVWRVWVEEPETAG